MIGHREAPTLGEHRKSFVYGTTRALRWGRALVVWGVLFGLLGSPLPGQTAANGTAESQAMTVDEATKLGEDFGVIVGDVDNFNIYFGNPSRLTGHVFLYVNDHSF